MWVGSNSEMCSENAMTSAEISAGDIFQECSASFLGPQVDVDLNTYLEEELQLYQDSHVPELPVVVLNSKALSLDSITPLQLKLRICNSIHPDPDKQPDECQKLTNPSLFSAGELLFVLAIVANVVVCLMLGCKLLIRRKMRGEIQ